MFFSLIRLAASTKLRRRASRPQPSHVLIEATPPPILATLKELWQSRNLCLRFIVKDISVQYKQTALGIVWLLFRPLVTVAIFATIFRFIVRFPSEDTPYAVFVMCGIVPWLYFSEALIKGISSLHGNSHIVTRIYFPRMILPISVISAPVIDLAVGIVALLIVTLMYGLTPSPHIVFLPLFLLLMYLFVLALSLCLAAPQAIFRDVAIIFKFLLNMWMFLSPVLYPLNILPPLLQKILIFNPLTGIIAGIRWSVVGGDLRADATLVSVVATALLLLAGVYMFRRLENSCIDHL